MTEQLVHWLSNQLQELQDTNDAKKPILIEIKAGLSALDDQRLGLLSSSVDLNPCFDSFNNADEETVNLVVDVLFVLLNSLNGQEALTRYGNQLENSLKHKSHVVKKSLLKILQKHVTVESILIISSTHSGILTQVIECLACPDRSIAEGAVAFFKNLGKSSQGVKLLFTCGFIDVMKRIMTIDDISRFRIYEILVDIAVKSPEGLKAGHDSKILSSLLQELKSSDTLIQLNVLELLTHLSSVETGLLYLQREGAIQYLVDKIINLKDEPVSFILLPGLIEFFGNLYKSQPVVFAQQHPEVLQILFENFDTVDPALLGVIISTVGKIGSSDEGRIVLTAQNEKMILFLNKVGIILKRKDELCVTAMNSLAVFFESRHAELSATLEMWFVALGAEAMKNIVEYAKLPFAELRLSAMELLHKISSHAWGVVTICSYPGLLEFLLDRSVEFDKHCKRAKYDIVVSLTANSTISSTVPTNIIIKLKEFVKEGPFYVYTEPEMAFDGAS